MTAEKKKRIRGTPKKMFEDNIRKWTGLSFAVSQSTAHNLYKWLSKGHRQRVYSSNWDHDTDNGASNTVQSLSGV